MYKFSAISIIYLVLLCGCTRNIKLHSPDSNLKLIVKPGGTGREKSIASFSLMAGKKEIILPSSLFIRTMGSINNSRINLIRIETDKVRNNWVNDFGERKDIPDNYNEMILYLKCDSLQVNLIFRAYNEGIGMAYEFPAQEGYDTVKIEQENIVFRFPGDHMTWSAPAAQARYKHVPLSRIDKGCERPLLVECDSTNLVALAEAGQIDFPRMKFDPDSSGGISIRSRLDSHAKKKLPFRSPWRALMAGSGPGDLLEKNYLLLNLNDSSAIKDKSWIKPGKALREVTLTTAGGIASVDFTATHGMQYVEFDAGWYGPETSDKSDATIVNIDPARSKGPLDLPKVISYAHSKNIGVLLYVNRIALEKQIDTLLPLYNKWGVDGIKFGFVQVGNQEVTSWLLESIRKAAVHRMIVDVHDEYRPTGFSRTYPNFLTQEGIRGDEESPDNSHTLITMFTRMLAGAGDNTVCYYNDRVEKKMGSHASQLAKAVCIFSPLQFLYWYDKPSGIGNEPELEFFKNVPTVWDETRVLVAETGKCGVIARKKGGNWFIGGINGDSPKTLNLNFSFLDPDTDYMARFYTDDPAVNTTTHVKVDSTRIDNTYMYKANINPGNGFAIQIIPL